MYLIEIENGLDQQDAFTVSDSKSTNQETPQN